VRFLAYPTHIVGTTVTWRVLRQEDTGRIATLDAPLCEALAGKRGGTVQAGIGRALVVDTAGLRAVRRYYVDAEGDAPTIYGAGGQPFATVCGALRSLVGHVPDGGSC
jgi:hypothetical protein